MIVMKAYRYRLYPTTEQEMLFRRIAGSCRFVFNLCLSQKILERHRSNPRRLTAYDQASELKDLKAEVEWLREAPSHCLMMETQNVERAFKNFFAGRTAFPTFKKRGSRASFRFPDPKQIKIEPGRVFLPKAGWVEMRMHRDIVGTPKNATVSRDADCWFVSIQTETTVADPRPNIGAAIGIDIGITKPLMLSTGQVIDLPKTSKIERHRLATLQRRVKRKTKGSRNMARARMAVARFQAKLARRRKDAAHKATTHLVQNHGVIVIEDLRVRNMTASATGTIEAPGRNVAQKSGLNRSMLDIAPFQIRQMLEYKAPWHGSRIVVVPAPYTSQRCHKCGHVHRDNRVSQAVFICQSCAWVGNADVNASLNILAEGLSVLACGSSPSLRGRKQESSAAKLRSSVL
jgi:putative transposase